MVVIIDNDMQGGIVLVNGIGIENRGLDQGFFNAICSNYLDRHPVLSTLGIQTLYMGEGITGIRICPGPKYSSAGNRVHGGIIATLVDVAMSRASLTITGRLCRTVDIHLSYMAPAMEDTELIAEAKVTHAGQSLVAVEGTVVDENGRLILKSMGSFIIDRKYPAVWEL